MITLRSRHAAVALALSAALALAGCVALVPKPTPTPVPPTPTTGPASGVEGIVLVGPTCPVERLGDPCPDKPVAVDLALYDARYAGPTYGPPVVTFKSGDDGHFMVPVAPGDYILARAPCSTVSGNVSCVFPSITPANVTVKLGAYTQVVVHGDTGIR